MAVNFWAQILRTVFPLRDECVCCGVPGEMLCHHCRGKLHQREPFACERCGRALGHTGKCEACLQEKYLPLRGASAYTYQRSAIAITALKYRGAAELADIFARDMAAAARALPLEEVDAVIAVPMHFLRGITRGYNQADLLARKVASLLQLSYIPRMLRRKKYKPSMSRALQDHGERSRWVAGVYDIGKGFRAVRCVLLVDDVLTSGATLSECTRVLQAHGVQKIYALTAAAVAEDLAEKRRKP